MKEIFKKISEIFKAEKKKEEIRTDCDYLGLIAGHKWYKPSNIDDTITDRYLDYVKLSEQYDQLGIKYNELLKALDLQRQVLHEGNLALAIEYNQALMAYVELPISNDIVFSIVNCFLLIDDEPLHQLSGTHTALKQKLYNENNDVKIFFCELYNILKPRTLNFMPNTNPYSFLKEALTRVAEGNYLKLFQVGN